MKIYASNEGIYEGHEIGAKLNALLKKLSLTDESKELIFENGDYYINAASCDEHRMYITNTAGDDEYKAGENPHLVKVAFYLKNIRGLTVRGNGAKFTVIGKAVNIAVRNCEDITFEDMEISVNNPDFHEFKVLSKTFHSVDFRLTGDGQYVKNPVGLGFSFKGDDYTSDFFADRGMWSYFHRISAGNENHVERVKHPFSGVLSLVEKEKNVFRAVYPMTERFTPGETYVIYKARRQYNGIFVENSKDITLRRLSQHFNYGLAFVAQNTENITVDSCKFAPENASGRLITSVADFIQMCMCKGLMKITDCFFCGAGDDVLNVHGIHFAVSEITENTMKVSFMHPQSHGFNPLNAGDKIEFVNPDTLTPHGSAVILSSRTLDENNILLKTDNTDGAKKGDVIEDITLCPDVYFAGNRMTRIITRGLLITTRGKVTVENNDFEDTSMAGILISDDAKNWYESGSVTDVTIRGNRFGDCGAYNIQVLPENGKTGSIVHGKILIEDNIFESPSNGGIDLHSTHEVVIKNNTVKRPANNFVRADNVETLVSDI